MKTLITALAMMLTITSVATNKHDDDILVVEGKFVAQTNVNYKVYEIQADSSLKEVFSHKSLAYFTCELEVGNHYVICFTSQTQEVKKLYVDVTESGSFQVLVDFNKPNSAELTYNKRKSKYQVKSIPMNDVQKNSKHRI